MFEKFSPRGKPFEHETDGGKVDERFRSLDFELVIFAQAAIPAEPRKRALHDPGQAHHLEGALLALGAAAGALPVVAAAVAAVAAPAAAGAAATAAGRVRDATARWW